MLRIWIVIAGLLVLFPGMVLAQPDPSPPEMRDDAELSAIAFLDADRGWAVGDRGVIWHTSDGGRAWGQQNSGVTCRLEAVQFLDANNGWAVGGWTQPYTHETRGVVLRTRDGGRTWQNISTLVLPGLKSVRFFDARQGWALGDGSPLFPTGVFRTEDGGRTWLPVPKGDTLGWVTGDFRDMRGGAVAGLGGTLGIVGTSEVRVSRPPAFGPRYLRRMQLVGQAGGWLVGDGGLVATTSDAGVTWQPPAGALPEVAADLDFRALAVVGPRIWMAGAPGTCVLHSADGGRSWQIQPTEQTAPLAAIFFLDENRGWAVGALGTILQTRDGGQTWRLSRSGGKRAALLGVFSEPQRVPLELFAQASGSDAYLSAVEIVGRRDLEPATAPEEFSTQRRTHEAVLAAGGCAANTAWSFPIFERGLYLTQSAIVARWNQLSEGQALARLEEHLVGRIRQWRPEVIVTEDVSPRGEDPLAHLTNQATLAAVAKAADAKQYPRQVAAGLAAWTVKKVFTVQTYERQSLVNITPAQWSPQLGRSLADIAESGRRLLSDDVTPSPRTIGLGLLVDHLPQETGRRDIMSGIVLGPGGEARRKLSQPPPGDLAQLSALARKRHNVEQLLSRVDSGNASADHWLGQIDNLTQGLPERHSGEILWQLARQYQRAGKGDSAAEALELLLRRYPAHPLADSAALWLVRYYTSSETAWRNRRETSYNVQLVSATSQRQDSSQPTAPTTDEDGAPLEIIDRSQRAELSRSGQRQTAAPALAPAQRAGRALAVANALERTRPTLLAAPTMQFPLSVGRRHAGPGQRGRNAPKEATLGITGTMPAGPWSDCVAAEGWIESGRGEAPKRVLSVVTAAEKPKLDGRLDDPLWQSAKSVRLTAAAGQTGPPSTAVLAFDEEFLYFAVSCQKMDGVDYSATEEPRPHDSDLFRQDRVTLQLDVDRDYATWWELSIDHRGRPATSCFGDATWNPTWFIAAGGDESWWTVEAAIPLAELAPKKPAVRDVWAAQVQRAVPGWGVEALSHPAAIEPRPEGFGLLVFE